MTIKEIIDGLKFTMDMCLFSPIDGSKRPVSMLNDMDKITYDACEGAIRLLEQQRWIPVNERLPEEYFTVLVWCPERKNIYCAYYKNNEWFIFGGYNHCLEEVIAWMPLPEPFREEDKG